MDEHDIDAGRRGLLKGSGAAVAAAFAGPIAALASRHAGATSPEACLAAPASAGMASPYGPIAPVKDLTTGLPLIQLPKGFSYKSYGWTGDRMSDGLPTPGAHDGMGIVSTRRIGRSTEIRLVRNHERSTSSNAANIIGASVPGVPKHDEGTTGGNYQIGGNTTVVWRDGNFVESYASLGGLNRPCAGGSTLWGSWLSNEEIRSDALSSTGRKHGYVFEVPAHGMGNPLPIIGMGRMAHEASAVDPETGYWYLTEDQGNANTLYRFRPRNVHGGLGSLHDGGVLQGLAVRGVPRADLRFPTLCQEFICEWVDIADPDANSGSTAGIPVYSLVGGVLTQTGTTTATGSGPYRQAAQNGAAIFGATEGCWVANGLVYFTDKATGTSPLPRAGVIWALHLASMTLKAVFVSRDRVVGNSPDNLTISPRGGVLFCEDGGNGSPQSAPIVAQELKALHPGGAAYTFAAHNFNFTAAQTAAVGKAGSGDQRNTEWAGACFSEDGRVLFVNLYTPGITLAITGPWANGTL